MNDVTHFNAESEIILQECHSIHKCTTKRSQIPYRKTFSLTHTRVSLRNVLFRSL